VGGSLTLEGHASSEVAAKPSSAHTPPSSQRERHHAREQVPLQPGGSSGIGGGEEDTGEGGGLAFVKILFGHHLHLKLRTDDFCFL
jgi:hypothetical protein